MNNSFQHHIHCPVCGQEMDATTADRVFAPDGVMIHMRLEDAVAKELELAELRQFKAETLFSGVTIDHED